MCIYSDNSFFAGGGRVSRAHIFKHGQCKEATFGYRSVSPGILELGPLNVKAEPRDTGFIALWD